MKLLLLSTGGRPLFQHARGELTEFLAGCRRVGFVTAANLFDETAYFDRAKAFFGSIDVEVIHVQWRKPPSHDLRRLDAIVVGGGNTYALLERLRLELFDEISYVVRAGMPYVGASAGSNVAGPNILTTNDWNVVNMSEFEGFGFVRCNINPHYPNPMTRAARGGTRFGETRDERIAEYHLMHRNPVIGLEEPAIIHVDGSTATVRGKGRVRWFARGEEPVWFSPGDHLPLGRRTR